MQCGTSATATGSCGQALKRETNGIGHLPAPGKGNDGGQLCGEEAAGWTTTNGRDSGAAAVEYDGRLATNGSKSFTANGTKTEREEEQEEKAIQNGGGGQENGGEGDEVGEGGGGGGGTAANHKSLTTDFRHCTETLRRSFIF